MHGDEYCLGFLKKKLFFYPETGSRKRATLTKLPENVIMGCRSICARNFTGTVSRGNKLHIYDLLMFPLERFLLNDIRREIISKANGNVLELGIGTGVNISYYDRYKVNSFTGFDRKLYRGLAKKAQSYKGNFMEGTVENLPFPDNCFDTIVGTLLLCSVADTDKALGEIKRVLKPNGTYLFIEHILPEEKKLAGYFTAANKVWPKLTNGCNLNRRTDIAIKRSGFDILEMGKKGNNIFCYGIVQKR